MDNEEKAMVDYFEENWYLYASTSDLNVFVHLALCLGAPVLASGEDFHEDSLACQQACS